MKKSIAIFILILAVIQLCACQANPDQAAVISKNGEVFESNMHRTADDDAVSPTQITNTEEFYSTDGSVEFSMKVDHTLTAANMPVVEVEPYNLTGDDVQRIAHVLFGDAVFYERDKSSNPTSSKKQIQKNINRWSQYTNPESMISLYTDSSTDPSYDISLLEKFIAQLNEEYKNAPEENPAPVCNWQLKKERYYSDLDVEIDGRDEDDDSNVIYAYTEYDGFEYVLAATNHNQKNYVSNTISIGLQSAFGLHWDTAIWRAELCRTAEPTEEQVTAVRNKAEDILSEINLGNWAIKHTYVQTVFYGETPEYTIVVDAVPVLNGVSAIWGQRTESIVSDNAFASNYSMSKIEITFSPSGDLVYFDMISPITVKEVVNTNVETLPLESLIETAKSHLKLSDCKAGYGLSRDSGLIELYEETFNEKIICKIEISEIGIEMGRIRKADSDNSFYYVPTLVFAGTAEYYGKDSGTLYLSSNDYYETAINLVMINAVDGTVIGS